MTEISCATDVRRSLVRRQRLFGIDSVEPNDDGRTLIVTFLGKAPRDDRERHRIGHRNVRIDGGRRITGIRVIGVDMEYLDDSELDDRMTVRVDRAGDSSEYTLCVVTEGPDGRPGTAPFPGFDPRYHCAPFGFRAGSPTDDDCAAAPDSLPSGAGRPGPVIDYTAKDYDSLLRLLLDRMTLTVPAWTERHVPDLGVTLAELLAYTGDQLSYQQDAVATEAYLTTARRRVSVRRHVRLIDYAMHDGCNARAFVTVEVSKDVPLPHGGYRFVALDVSDLPPQERPALAPVISDEQLRALPPGTTHVVFEPLGHRAQSADLHLHRAHNTIGFWTWGNEDCCLPAGATSATLRDPGRALRLRPGDLLVIEEVIGPRTGTPADADPAHRQAVRLTSVTPGEDELFEQPVVEVTWAQQDALTFDVCLSAHGGPDCALLADVSVARGNVVLADHGQSLSFCGHPPKIFPVPPAAVTAPACGAPACGCPGQPDLSPAAELVHALIAGARAGRTVTPGEVSELTGLVGGAAVTRAGLSADDCLADQVAELETLLAQLTYPAVPATFRPVLSGAPVTQCAAYPSPRLVSAGQATVLGGLAGRVRDRVHGHWRSAADGAGLSAEAVAELEAIFGRPALDRARLAEGPERALRELLARFDELLGVKLERLATLTARAAAGTVLGTSLVWEIGHTWGRRYLTGLDPEDPVLAGPAAASLAQDPRTALPAVRADAYDSAGPASAGSPPPADSPPLAGTWLPARDLLAAGPRDRLFVGDLGDDGQLALRFGDGIHGAAPPADGELRVSYRVGNGTAGNVGAAAINHLVLCGGDELPDVRAVRNPMPADGGTDPEPVSDVRQLAPLASRAIQLRAVTADDYAGLATRISGVLRAAADIRWTGSGEEVHVAVEPAGPASADRRAGPTVPSEALIAEVTAALTPLRRIGHGLVVGAPELVPLDIELQVLVEPGYQRRDVLAALHRVFGTGLLPGGAPAFFSPRALGFGEPVRVSRLMAAAVGVPGVASARVTRLKRLASPGEGELAAGLLRIGPLAIAVCDSRPDQPENGRVSIVAEGGR
jgi:predicted phage baseplate assembly protein